MHARIYRPSGTVMQSGRAKIDRWILEFERESPSVPEPLMGWTSSRDIRQQVRLRFATREAAMAYANRRGIAFTILEPQERTGRLVCYADNFRFDRRDNWTH